ncbi:ribokinase [soil metagenome]
MSHAAVTILGSANMDVVFTVDRIPMPGETLLASASANFAGGKGLNQAVAASRAGAVTRFLGALGGDDFGESLATTMSDEGIANALVRRVAAPTGQAFIVVDAKGENTIIVASGANGELTGLRDDELHAARTTDVLLMQLEIPMATVIEGAAAARAADRTVILNAAPAEKLSPELFDSLDYLIVNEHEACLIGESEDLDVASATLAKRVGRLIVTLGSKGSVLYESGKEVARVIAPRVKAVDTTGAGDTFCGAFAAAIAEGLSYAEAARFASAAAALSVQSVGAVPSVPSRAAIDEALEKAAIEHGIVERLGLDAVTEAVE